MFTEIYIQGLLVDPDQADSIWQLWIEGRIDDDLAMIAWLIVAV
jgi:hypothetical protein